MSFIARLQRAREILEQQGRLSIRALVLEIGDEELDELIEELVDVQQVARREGKILVWVGTSAVHSPDVTRERPTPVAPSAPRPSDQAEARKVVTIIFADLIGSTSLHERLDAESTRRLMDRYYRALHTAVETHGGTVVKLMGDGVMAAFGVPRVTEDDAIRAVRAGVAMQHAFRELARNEFAAVGDIGLRVGINTGEVVVSADNTDVVGDPVNVAARLQGEAHDGEVVIGESTRRLVAALVTLAPLGSFALKGRAEAMKAYRVESLDRPVGTTTAAFVGRDDELGRITAVYDAAIAAPAARLAVLLGSPGLGKSRMIEEFTRRLGAAATVLTAQCDAEGGATFAPLAEALRELFQPDDAQVPVRGETVDDRMEDALREPQRERSQNHWIQDDKHFSVRPEEPPSLGGVSKGVPARASTVADDQQPQRGDPPVARGVGEDLHAALEAAVAGTDAERTRIVAGITALLAGSPASPEETFFVVRRLLAALAATKPVVLVIDDLHWAEPLLLDLVEHLVQWGTGVPLLVLVGARPELRDTRSSLATSGGLVADVVTLAGLDAGAAMRLAANVIGAADLPAAVAAKVLATSEGNPLFVAELVRMLVQEGALRQEGERWTAGVGLAALEMPPTIHALLAARIERLRPEDRSVLERAAVIGRHFSRSAVAALLPREVTDLDARLEALRRSELIEPDTGWFLGEPVLRFHHVLIRDAAYRRLLKGTRAELHGRIADWIASRAPDAVEHDETLGWHLEQAHQLLGELGPIDAQGRALGERASIHLAAAGRRALARDDVPLAASLLGRALDRLDAEDPSRAELALDWCEALLAAGDVGTAAKAIDELGRFITGPSPGALPRADGLPPFQGSERSASNAEGQQPQRGGNSLARGTAPGEVGEHPAGGSERLSAWHTCFVGQLTVMTAPQAVHATADAVAAAAAALTALGDAAGEAKAHFVHAQVFRRLGKVGACEAALDRALAAARRAGDRRRANTVLAIAPLAALWGPSPVTRASGRCLDVVRVLRITQGAPAVEAVALSCQAVLEALRGRTDAARRMIASSRKMVEDLGITQRLLEVDVFGGLIDLLEGDAAATERSLRGAYDGLRDLGLGIDAARAAALLARALLAQGRVDEAEALSHESEALAGDDLKAAIAWRGVRAEALAQRGGHAAAIELARAGVEIAAATDALLDHADARLALAAALRAAGRGTDADAEERRAIELWETKGATLLAERARRDVPPVAPAARAPERETQAPPARRVRANAATASAARVPVAFAARDLDGLAAQLADGMETVHHPTGLVYDRAGAVASFRSSMRGQGACFENQPIAALGDSLVLCHQTASASATGGTTFDVGAYERRELALIETADDGRIRRVEIFAADHLGDAIARLYERYAALLPEGPARTRATATARSVASLTASYDLDRIVATLAPDVEVVDHRIEGYGTLHGAAALEQATRTLLELVDGFDWHVEDVLALDAGALVVHQITHGTDRASGGAFERRVCELVVFGADGRIIRYERFDGERSDQALARFDELTGSRSLPLKEPVLSLAEGGGQEGFVDESFQQILPDPPFSKEGTRAQAAAPPIRRRVRPNAVTAFWARFDTAFAARDADAVDACFSDSFAETDHTVGASYGRDGALTSIRRLLRSPDPGFRHEALATLGPSLGLVRGLISASGTGGGRFDVGAYEIEEIKVTQVDEQRQLRSAEVFASDRLGDAIARLYERYAESLPEGAESARAAARARTIAAGLHGDGHHPRELISPDIEFADHRRLGFGSVRSAAVIRDAHRSLEAVAADLTFQVHDVLALAPAAFLVPWTSSGTHREGGGAFENHLLMLRAYDTAGLVCHIEWFDAGDLDAALARFNELTRNIRHAGSLLAGIQDRGVDSRLVTAGMTERPPPVSPLGTGRTEEGTSRAPFANAVTRLEAFWQQSWAARDWDAVTAVFAPGYYVDDRRSLMHMRFTGEAFLEQLRMIFEVSSGGWHYTCVATRGERLALHRIVFDGEVRDGGGSLSVEYLQIDEIDNRGRSCASIAFDLDDIDAAYAELDARYDGGEGTVHPAHVAFLRAYTQAITSRDWDPVVALCAPTLVEYDHRALAVLGTTRGVEAWVQNFRTLTDLTTDTVYRVDHFRSAAHGFWSVGTWRGSREGGDYEIPINAVLEMDGRDRLARSDIYDPDQFDQPRARFDELTRGPVDPLLTKEGARGRSLTRHPETSPDPSLVRRGTFNESDDSSGRSGPRIEGFANAATRAVERGTAALAARDWEGFAALCATDFRHYDRTRIAQLETDGREWLASFRRMVEMTSSRPTHQLLATRGERLALFRMLWRGAEGDIGPSEIDWVLIIEVDGRGDHVAVVAFDPEDLDAAYAELEARWAAGEATTHPRASAWVREFQRAFAARDWEAMTALHAPDQVAVNHRTVGWGTLRGPGAWVPTLEALVELAPDTRFRLDHLRTCERGILWQSAWQGTRDGGPFETPLLVATELDDHGRQIRMDVWDADVFEPACARFAELTAAVAAPRRFDNAATATLDPVIASIVAHDWRGLEQLFSENFRCSDRRRLVQLELDRDQYVAFIREVGDGRTIRGDSQVIATRGNRLALARSIFEFADADVGPSAIAFLILTQVDDRGRIVAYVRFDLDDLDAAYAELESLWEAGEAAAHPLASRWLADYQRCFAARDWNAMAAIMAPDLVSQSHRLVSWGTLHGPQGLVSTMRVQMELAPDTQLRGDHIRTCAVGLLMEYAWYGTRDGGAFENLLSGAVELDTTGRARRVDVWEAEQVDQAQARFGQIAGSRGQPHVPNSGAPVNSLSLDTAPKDGAYSGRTDVIEPRIEGFGNTATRAWSKLVAAWRDRDWQRFASLRAADFRFFDRTPVAQLELDGDQHLEYIRSLGEMNVVRSTQDVLATRGDRLALGRFLIEVAGGEVGPSEIMSLFLTETNARGEVQAFVRFEGDALDAAYAELDERFEADEAAAHGDAAAWNRAFRRLFERRDWDALIELGAPALVAHDHRLAGWGTQRGPAAWVQALRSLVDLAPDVRTRADHVRMSDRGFLTEAVQWGTRDGGAFEIPVIGVFELGEQGKLCRLDLYDPGQLEQARARFDAIGASTAPDPLRIPPNASTRANDRWWAYAEAEDWGAVRALTAGMVFEDRRRLIRIAGGSELLLADTRHLWDSGWRPTRILLATAGDRLSLERMLWTLEDGGQVSEIEVLKVAEIDAEGRIVAYIIFDADDRRAASADLLERHARSGADEIPALWFEFWRAWNDHDLGRLRTLLPADYSLYDHRHTGIGRVESDAYIVSLGALFELSPDVWLEPLYWVAGAAHGRVAVIRWVGTNAEGGEFEAVFVGLSLYRGEQLVGAELFEIADLDAALARFEALRAARTT